MYHKLIPTFSPQGDGNAKRRFTGSPSKSPVDPYLFPARGRKLGLNVRIADLKPTEVDPYLFPARGRKREVPIVSIFNEPC